MGSPNSRAGFWRPALFLALAACFFVHSYFVYSDFPANGISKFRLSEEAVRGLNLWRKHNCQACHQIYGFGGFLGPDLTNVLGRRPDEDWTEILTTGRKQMPAFGFTEKEQGSLLSFLAEIGATGRSIPAFTRLEGRVDDNSLVENYVKAGRITVEKAVLQGEAILRRNRCHTCHRTFREGNKRAPDLSRALALRSPAYIRKILRESRGSMPSFNYLTAPDIGKILSYLEWLRQHRREIGLFYSTNHNGDEFSWAALPWFEY